MLTWIAQLLPGVGQGPSNQALKEYASSDNFDPHRGTFVNRRHDEYEKMMNSFDFVQLSKENFFGKEIREPLEPLPVEQPDWSKWNQQENAYIWLGHSTILFRIAGKNILFDPVFGNAAPVFFAVPRFQKTVVSLDELPPIDTVFISHDHYDHLSYDAMLFFKDRHRPPFMSPWCSHYLVGWGIDLQESQSSIGGKNRSAISCRVHHLSIFWAHWSSWSSYAVGIVGG